MSKILGVDLTYFLNNGFWVALRYAVVSLLGLVLSVAFARLGTKDLLGQYQFILSFTALFSLFSLPGLNISALKSIAQGSGNSVIRKGVQLSFLFGLAAIPLMLSYLVYRFFTQDSMDPSMAIALLIAILIFPFFYAPNTWYAAYEGRSLFRPVTLRTILSSLITTTAIIAGLYFQLDIQFLILLYFILNTAFSWYFFTEVISGREEKTEHGAEKLDVRYGVGVTMQKFAYGLSENIPPIAISFFLGFKLLAIFQIAYFFTNSVSSLIGALFAMYLPKIFITKKVTFTKELVQCLIAGIVCFVGLVAFTKLGFFFFYGKDYRESYELTWMIAPLLVLAPLRVFLINLFTARANNIMIILCYILANCIGVIVFLLLKDDNPLIAMAAYMYALNCFAILFLLLFLFYKSRKYSANP